MRGLPRRLTKIGHSVSYLESLSMKRLSKETGIPRHTLMYRIRTMGLSVEEAVNHPKHQWVKR
jgi:hypothetical protein